MVTPTLPSGVMVALVTPLDADGHLDEASLERVVERVVAGGVRGVCPTGSTGEGARLTAAQRLAVTRRVRALAPAGVPVLPGVPLTTLEEGVAELGEFEAAGADAALVAPPSYYPLSDEGARRLFTGLADRSPLPVVLYNIPMFTKVTIGVRVAADLAAHPRVVGIKDSSRDMEYQSELIAATRAAADFSVYTGSDTLLLASALLGARGAIAASANLVPGLGVALFEAVADGDLDRARQLQDRLFAVVKACRRGDFPAGWKAALEVVGVCSGRLADPAAGLPPAERDALAARLASLGVSKPAGAAR